MMFDHFMFSLGDVFGYIWGGAKYNASAFKRLAALALEYWSFAPRVALQVFFAGTFVFLSGVSGGFSKSNLKRGARLAVVAAGLSLVTLLVSEVVGERLTILFGVLHMLAFSMLLYGLLELIPLSKNRRLIFNIVVGAVFLTVGIIANNNPIDGNGIGAIFFYSNSFSFITADYFPIFPHTGIFFLGAAAGSLIYKNKKSIFERAAARKAKAVAATASATTTIAAATETMSATEGGGVMSVSGGKVDGGTGASAGADGGVTSVSGGKVDGGAGADGESAHGKGAGVNGNGAAGAGVGIEVGGNRLKKWTRPFNYVGRRSLLFYLGHQVVIFTVLYLLGLVLGFGGI
jgi:uncharacterized membrane protein